MFEKKNSLFCSSYFNVPQRQGFCFLHTCAGSVIQNSTKKMIKIFGSMISIHLVDLSHTLDARKLTRENMSTTDTRVFSY